MSGRYLTDVNLTLSETIRDRSRHSRNICSRRGPRLPEQSTSHHRSGEDSRVLRQYRQTAVALIRSRLERRKVGIRPRTSGGRRLTGTKLFWRYRADIQIARVLAAISSTWKHRRLNISLAEARELRHTSCSLKRNALWLDTSSKGSITHVQCSPPYRRE